MALRTTSTWVGFALDCDDASELAHFYERLLGWQVFADTKQWATLAPSKDAGYNLGFQRDERFERPTWPSEGGRQQMQAHLDVQVDDLEKAVTYAEECGAQQADFQPQEKVRVMLDPAGHPFCLYL